MTTVAHDPAVAGAVVHQQMPHQFFRDSPKRLSLCDPWTDAAHMVPSCLSSAKRKHYDRIVVVRDPMYWDPGWKLDMFFFCSPTRHESRAKAGDLDLFTTTSRPRG